jgi:branched-subunit amino acid transport protein AzlD
MAYDRWGQTPQMARRQRIYDWLCVAALGLMVVTTFAIAALVVYAYTQLEPPVSAAYAPYAAGAAAVALQLAFRSGILSVAASTALYMYLVA